MLIPKPGKTDYTDPSSYRPLSMLNVMSKLLEQIITKRLKDHLTKKGLLPPNQHGFRERIPTRDAVLKVKSIAIA